MVPLEFPRLAIGSGLCETVVMPKDRNKTYSDRQSEASRAKKLPKKVKPSREDSGAAAPRTAKKATEGH